MYPLFDDYHQNSKNLRVSQLNTENVLEIDIKTYERFNLVKLPSPQSDLPPLDFIIRTRKSARDKKVNPLSLVDISSLLFYSAGETDAQALQGRGRRAVASAGAKYPLETYLLTLTPIMDMKEGLYHYRADLHALEHILDLPISEIPTDTLFRESPPVDFQVAFFVTAIFARTTRKYAERGYRYVLLEAGALGQAIQNTSIALNLDSLMYGGVSDRDIENLLRIDGVSESLVHTVLVK